MAKARSSKISKPAVTTEAIRTLPAHLQVDIAVDEFGVRIIEPYSDGEICAVSIPDTPHGYAKDCRCLWGRPGTGWA